MRLLLAGLSVVLVLGTAACEKKNRLIDGGDSSASVQFLQPWQGSTWTGTLNGQPALLAFWKGGDHMRSRLTVGGKSYEGQGLDGNTRIDIHYERFGALSFRRAGPPLRVDVIAGGVGSFTAPS